MQESSFKPSEWKFFEKNLPLANIKIHSKDNIFRISGILKGKVLELSHHEPLFLEYRAANHPTINHSFSGSGLPFPNESIAFDHSQNCGSVPIHDRKFNFMISCPNSYLKQGLYFIGPEVQICVYNKNHIPVSHCQVIQLTDPIPFRNITYPKERFQKDAMFYHNPKLPKIRSQYEILMDSAYPDENQPSNLWRLKPPF